MSIFNQVNLTMFSTTVGHHGFRDIHKYSIKHLDKTIGLNNFANKTAAIKVHNGDEDVFYEMAKDYAGFNILKEVGRTKLKYNPHESVNDYTPYIVGNLCVSVANVYSLMPLYGKYNLWLEDDRLICSDEIEKYFSKAIETLETYPHVYSVHLNGPTFAKDTKDLFLPTKYCFNCHISRTENVYKVASCFKDNIKELINMHPEQAYELIVNKLFPDSFSVEFNAKYVNSIHLGQSDFLQLKEKHKLTI